MLKSAIFIRLAIPGIYGAAHCRFSLGCNWHVCPEVTTIIAMVSTNLWTFMQCNFYNTVTIRNYHLSEIRCTDLVVKWSGDVDWIGDHSREESTPLFGNFVHIFFSPRGPLTVFVNFPIPDYKTHTKTWHLWNFQCILSQNLKIPRGAMPSNPLSSWMLTQCAPRFPVDQTLMK